MVFVCAGCGGRDVCTCPSVEPEQVAGLRKRAEAAERERDRLHEEYNAHLKISAWRLEEVERERDQLRRELAADMSTRDALRSEFLKEAGKENARLERELAEVRTERDRLRGENGRLHEALPTVQEHDRTVDEMWKARAQAARYREALGEILELDLAPISSLRAVARRALTDTEGGE